MSEIMETATALVIAIGALVIAALVEIQRIKKQVVNNHSTNIRDDIDMLKDTVTRTETIVCQLADDMREERKSRRQIEAHAHDSHLEIFQRLNALEGKE